MIFVRRVVLWASTAAVLTCTAAAAGTPPALTACLDEENPPFSSHVSVAQGIDVEIAGAIARILGRELHIFWVQVPARGGFGKALRQSIQASKCDFFLGIPDGHEMAAELVDHQLVVTRPYLIVGYILASPPGTKPATLADAMRAKRIGALTATPADLFLHKRQFNRVPYGNNRELLVALRDREIDLALVWSPAIAVQDMAGAGNQFGIGSEQPDDDSLRSGLAIATRKTDVELMRQIDSAIEGLKVDGAFAKISEKYGLPYLQSR